MVAWHFGILTVAHPVQGEIVDNLALHAVPSDPTLLTVLLWMTDTDPAARPPAVTARCIFAWLQEDLWAHGHLCPTRLLQRWGMPPHPKLALFPAQVEPAIGPQAGMAPGDVMWPQGLEACTHDVLALPRAPPVLLHSDSMEWPEVHLPSHDGSLTAVDTMANVCVPCMGDLPARVRSWRGDGETDRLFETPFFQPPPSARSKGTRFREDSSTVVPSADEGPQHTSQPTSMLRTTYVDSMAHCTDSAWFMATPGLSSPGCLPAFPRENRMCESASMPSGPLTSLHQAFPSCCEPPSAQTSIMSRAADPLPEDEEPAQHGLCSGGSDNLPVPEDVPAGQPAGNASRRSAARNNWQAHAGTKRAGSKAMDLGEAAPVAGPAAQNGMSCCDAGTCAAALLGGVCMDGFAQHAAHKPRRVELVSAALG